MMKNFKKLGLNLFLFSSVILTYQSTAFGLTSAEIGKILPVLLGPVMDMDPDGDYDNDGLINSFEVDNGFDPNVDGGEALQDTDDDGLTTYGEQVAGTALDTDDSDGDGLTDSFEYINGLDPTDGSLGEADADADGDGLSNLTEQQLGSNAVSNDTDSDGIQDNVDTCLLDATNDLDGDGVCENVDTCPDWNAPQTDTNGDGIGDACQCGDINRDGALSTDDIALFNTQQSVESLGLAELQLCDINGDSICSPSDATLLNEHLTTGAEIRARCPTNRQIYDKALNRLAFGPDDWTRARIRELGLGAYIEEQLSPASISDTDFNNKMAEEPYATFAGYLAKPIEWLKARFCNVDQSHCLDDFAGGRLSNEDRLTMNLVEVKFLRAIYSNRQLDAVLRDFWYNHFNVFANVGGSRDQYWTTPTYEQTIAAGMYGQFEDLVQAVTESPAMMTYLDLRGTSGASPNENYARELMELHTIGNHNFTDNNILPAARILTGYNYNRYTSTGSLSVPANPTLNDYLSVLEENDKAYFVTSFSESSHFDGEKTISIDGNGDGNPDQVWMFSVNGTNSDPNNAVCNGIEATNGKNESLVLTCLLARHTMSAKRIGEKLIHRFLGDSAPVDQMLSDTGSIISDWSIPGTEGDLTQIVRNVLTVEPSDTANYTSAPGSYFERSLFLESEKVKRPLVFASSFVRAFGRGFEGSSSLSVGDTSDAVRMAAFKGLIGIMDSLDEDLYLVGPPTGYSELGSSWLGSQGALIKVNTIHALIEGVSDPIGSWDLPAVEIDPALTLGKNWYLDKISSNEELVDTIIEKFATGGTITMSSRRKIIDYINGLDSYPNQAVVKVRNTAEAVLTNPDFLTH